MDAAINRRTFLTGALTGATVLGAGLALPGAQLPAADPIKRNGISRMKLSLAAYSFRSFLVQNHHKPRPKSGDGSMTLLDFIDFCATQDLDGCELTSYYFPKTINDDYLNQVRQRTFRLGLDISGTAIGNNFCLPPGDERDFHLEMTRQWIDYSAAIGAPVIRIFAGYQAKRQTPEQAFNLCVAGINQSLDYASKKGVALALENHGGLTATPEEMLKLIKAVKPSPWFGVNFDGGNFRTEDPYRDLEKIAPYAINAQVKVAIVRNGKHEAADLARVIKILRDADYRGYVVLEYEEKADPRKAVGPYIKELNELIHA